MSSAADALYRLCLRALPADVRRDFGEDMVQMFRDYRRDERGRPARLLVLWMSAILIRLRAVRAPAPATTCFPKVLYAFKALSALVANRPDPQFCPGIRMILPVSINAIEA